MGFQVLDKFFGGWCLGRYRGYLYLRDVRTDTHTRHAQTISRKERNYSLNWVIRQWLKKGVIGERSIQWQPTFLLFLGRSATSHYSHCVYVSAYVCLCISVSRYLFVQFCKICFCRNIWIPIHVNPSIYSSIYLSITHPCIHPGNWRWIRCEQYRMYMDEWSDG